MFDAARSTLYDATRPFDALLVEHLAPGFVETLRYWQTKAAGRRAPRRGDIDPMIDLPRLAPDMLLWRVIGGREGYRCMLAGTRVCAVGEREFRGAAVAELPWDSADLLRHQFDRVAERLEAQYAERPTAWSRGDHAEYRHLLLPLSEDGQRSTMLWSLLTFV